VKHARDSGSTDAAEAPAALPDWVGAILSLALLGGSALAILGATYWLVTRF